MESGDNMNPVSKIKRIGNEHTGIYLLAQSYMAQRIFFKYRPTEKKKIHQAGSVFLSFRSKTGKISLLKKKSTFSCSNFHQNMTNMRKNIIN